MTKRQNGTVRCRGVIAAMLICSTLTACDDISFSDVLDTAVTLGTLGVVGANAYASGSGTPSYGISGSSGRGATAARSSGGGRVTTYNGGYSQRQAFEDCAANYRQLPGGEAMAAQCAQNARNMGTLR